MMGRLGMITGCNALVTGGSSGIGAAIAEGLAAAGCAVTVLGRDRTRLAALAHRLNACALVADLSPWRGDRCHDAAPRCGTHPVLRPSWAALRPELSPPTHCRQGSHSAAAGDRAG
jgi:NAD(P)-dependent dehydrogenase (short-subunit alcohol dehydrogenase family)